MSPLLRPLISIVPSTVTDFAQRLHLTQLSDAVNELPPFSVFSYTTPESNVSAVPATLGFNLASGVSVLWIKQSGNTTIGWAAIG